MYELSQGQFANLEKLQTILLTGNSIQDIEPQVQLCTN